VAVPPVGAGQGSQDEPHVAGSESLTQLPWQMCVPDLHRIVQDPPVHMGVPPPLGSLGHDVQLSPQAPASSSFAQRSPHL
jgi:hypothetical protein